MRKMLLILLIVFFTLSCKDEDHALSNMKNQCRVQEYTGLVFDKYIDEKDHGNPKVFIELNTNWSTENGVLKERMEFFNGYNNHIYDFIQIGDTLIKLRGELQIHIRRNNEETVLEYKFFK